MVSGMFEALRETAAHVLHPDGLELPPPTTDEGKGGRYARDAGERVQELIVLTEDDGGPEYRPVQIALANELLGGELRFVVPGDGVFPRAQSAHVHEALHPRLFGGGHHAARALGMDRLEAGGSLLDDDTHQMDDGVLFLHQFGELID